MSAAGAGPREMSALRARRRGSRTRVIGATVGRHRHFRLYRRKKRGVWCSCVNASLSML